MHTPSMDAKRKQLLRFKRKINKSEQHVEDQTCCLEQNWSDSLPGISVLFLQYVASTFSTVSHQNWFYTWNDVLHKMLISWPIHADFKWTPIKCLRERVSGAQCCSGSCFSIVHLTKKITFKKWKTIRKLNYKAAAITLQLKTHQVAKMREIRPLWISFLFKHTFKNLTAKLKTKSIFDS